MKLSAWGIIFLSFILSIFLMLTPVDVWLSDIWPIWIIPVITYWVMALPHRVGLFAAWFTGLILDILYNSFLGSHALALLIVAALFSKLARQYSFFSTFQQIVVQLFFSALYIGILALCQTYTNSPFSIALWWPALTTALLWPFVSALLRHYRQKFRMT